MWTFSGRCNHREKFTEAERQKAICVYLEGNGFRGTARILTQTLGKYFSPKTVENWVKKEGKKAKNEILANTERIPIAENDELFTYVKKNKIR